MATVLITGAAGFIGSNLARACLRAGDRVHGVDALTDYYEPDLKRSNVAGLADLPEWRFSVADLNEADLPALLEGVDVVYHLAAQPGVRGSWGETFGDYVSANVTALQRLLEAARAASLPRLVFASSSSVYGNAASFPTGEDSPLAPISPYGATKAFGEHLCRTYSHSFGLDIVVLRYFTVFGPRQRPDMAFSRILAAARAGEQITILGDGEQTRDFTFVEDAVRGTIDAAALGTAGATYNLGGGMRTSMNAVLELVAELAQARLDVRRVDAQPGDARDTAADTTRARVDLGYEPRTTLAEGLRAQLDWVQTPPDAEPSVSRSVAAS